MLDKGRVPARRISSILFPIAVSCVIRADAPGTVTFKNAGLSDCLKFAHEIKFRTVRFDIVVKVPPGTAWCIQSLAEPRPSMRFQLLRQGSPHGPTAHQSRGRRVGRTPWSAADAPVGLLRTGPMRFQLLRQGGPARTGRPPYVYLQRSSPRSRRCD